MSSFIPIEAGSSAKKVLDLVGTFKLACTASEDRALPLDSAFCPLLKTGIIQVKFRNKSTCEQSRNETSDGGTNRGILLRGVIRMMGFASRTEVHSRVSQRQN